MVTTSPDALYSPDNVDDYDLIVDLAAMQVSTQAALNNRVRHYSATTFSGLPTSGVSAGASAYTSTEGRFWRHNGTKWVLVGGQMPYASVRMAANMSVGTTYIGINTQNQGIAAAGNFTVPAGCGGVYDFSAQVRTPTEAANVFLQPFVNSTASGREATSGSQQYVNTVGMLTLNAGDVVQFRTRIVTGTITLEAGTSWFTLAYRQGS